MNRSASLFLALLLSATPLVRAQTDTATTGGAGSSSSGSLSGAGGSFGDIPVDISADTSKFEAGLAVAEGNVLIRYSDIVIYADYAQYNPDTRDILCLGNVRIFRQGKLFSGERAVYNLETKRLTAADFRGSLFPFYFSADTFNSIGANAYQGRNGVLTTSDNSKPDFTIRANGIRIYPNDHVVMRDAVFYLGQTPIFYFPYIYQSLNKEQGLLLSPGYTSGLGFYLFSRYNFPINDNVEGALRLDFMTQRGVAIGLEAKWGGDNKKEEFGKFTSYYLYDSKPQTNNTNTDRGTVDPNRYRVQLQDRTYLTEDIYSTIDVTKLSDPRFLEDFEPGEFKRDPNPDNVLALTKWNEDYTATFLARKSINEFFDFTERLPEFDLDFKRHPILGDSGLYYEGTTGAGWLRRNFATGSIFPDYDSGRFDTFHQITYPKMLFGWLSVVPRAGVRFTYYSDSGKFGDKVTPVELTDTSGNPTGFIDQVVPQLQPGGPIYRVVGEGGVETSFKLTKTWEDVQSRVFGLDGFRHVLQPYMDIQYVETNVSPTRILQFDRVNPSTQLPPVDFSQFNTLDSITDEAVVQLGARNRFETRRDSQTITWLELNGFFNINMRRPQYERTFLTVPDQPLENRKFDPKGSLRNIIADPGTFSDVFTSAKFYPVPWANLTVDSQAPVFDKGFWEVDTSANFLVTENVQFNVSHRYISGNAYFTDSNQLTLRTYLRLSDNWGFSVQGTYEFDAGLLEDQRYELHRDLSSWLATFGVVISNNGGGKEDVGLELVFTLKDLPLARLPLNLDTNDLQTGGSSSGN